MTKPPKTRTRPGLGETTGLPRMDSAEIKRVRDGLRPEEPSSGSRPPPGRTVRDSIRREEDPDPEPAQTSSERTSRTSSERPVQTPASWRPEAQTGLRRKRESRAPVTVDEVGDAAVKLARTTRRESAPKLIASRLMIAKAPIDTRAAFVLSLVDGRNTVDALVDMSGMPEPEVKGILERLARLGLISVA